MDLTLQSLHLESPRTTLLHATGSAFQMHSGAFLRTGEATGGSLRALHGFQYSWKVVPTCVLEKTTHTHTDAEGPLYWSTIKPNELWDERKAQLAPEDGYIRLGFADRSRRRMMCHSDTHIPARLTVTFRLRQEQVSPGHPTFLPVFCTPPPQSFLKPIHLCTKQNSHCYKTPGAPVSFPKDSQTHHEL